jgi:hypothetical protein
MTIIINERIKSVSYTIPQLPLTIDLETKPILKKTLEGSSSIIHEKP